MSSASINIVAVHGTFEGVANFTNIEKETPPTNKWWQSSSEFAQSLVAELKADEINWVDIQWSGGNLETGRLKGAKLFEKQWKGAGCDEADLNLIISHSHGGNVVFNWLSRYKEDLSNTKIVSLGTPFVHYKRPSILRIVIFLLWMSLIAFTAGTFLGLVVSDMLVSYHPDAYNRPEFREFERYAIFTMPCLLYTSPSPRDKRQSRMPSSA